MRALFLFIGLVIVGCGSSNATSRRIGPGPYYVNGFPNDEALRQPEASREPPMNEPPNRFVEEQEQQQPLNPNTEPLEPRDPTNDCPSCRP